MVKINSDKTFLFFLILLSVLGLLVFSSASMGVLVKNWDGFEKIILKQVLLGIVFGWIVLIFISRINYKKWYKPSALIFIVSIILSSLVFIPGIGMRSGGANRWIDLGFTTFQPSEFLKFGFVLFLAAYFYFIKEDIKTFKYGFLLSSVILAIPVFLLYKQPDLGTLLSIVCTFLMMFLIAGCKKIHFFYFLLLGILMVALWAYTRPYAMDRIKTFLDPSQDKLDTSYHINQSLIAIGSGKILGKGFGQSVQKFSFLPEPMGDSVFAVASEEFGFLGSCSIVLIFLFLGLRGLKIASRANDSFGRLLTVGIITLIISQSFINMGVTMGIVPFTGIPLIFLSQGGSALFVTLMEMGIVLNISKHQNQLSTQTQTPLKKLK